MEGSIVEEHTTEGSPKSSSSSSTTTIPVTALDGLVSVNSVFTVGVFIGMSLAAPGQQFLENRGPCNAGIGVAKYILFFEAISFAFFLLSSVMAQGLKLAINIIKSKDVDEAFKPYINHGGLRLGMLVSGVSSVAGCVFLILSIANVIQLRLGLLSCGGESVVAVSILACLVATGLLIYISIVIYAFRK